MTMKHLQPTETRSGSPAKGAFKPRIVLFQCRFNHYSNADLQQIEILDSADVKCIQVPCVGRISPLFILNAVQGGADGIAVSGCRPGVCHYQQGNLGARRQLAAFRDLLTYVGMAAERLHFIWLDPADRGRLAGEMKALIAAVGALGPARRLVARPFALPAMDIN
jgi:coenzyme F420-reducing hydrogenase delta subunit